jgi:hypothetical protein
MLTNLYISRAPLVVTTFGSIFLLMSALLSTLLYPLDWVVIICAFIAVWLGAINTPWSVPLAWVMPLITIFLVWVAAFGVYLPTLSGPDERIFFENLVQYNTSQLLFNAIDSIRGLETLLEFSTVTWVSSRVTFPLFLSIFSPSNAIFQPEIIIAFNVMLWGLAAYYLSRAAFDFVGGVGARLFSALLLIFLFLSPSSVYWASVFAKDLITASFIALGGVAFYRGRHILGFVLSVVAGLFSTMAFIFIPVLYFMLQKNVRALAIVLGAGIVVLFVLTQSIEATLNFVPMSIYSLLSPSPFNADNWVLFSDDSGSWEKHPRGFFLLEGIILSVVFFVGAALALLRRSQRLVLLVVVLAVLITGTTWAVRGVLTLDNYGFGSTGGNFVRYKVGAWPIIAFAFALGATEIVRAVSCTKTIRCSRPRALGRTLGSG